MSERQYKRDRSGQFAAGGLISGGAAVAAAAGGSRIKGEARLGAREAELKSKWNVADIGQRLAGFNESKFNIKSDRRENWQKQKNEFQAAMDAIPGQRKKLKTRTNRGLLAAGALGAAGTGIALNERFGKKDDHPHPLAGLGGYLGAQAGLAATAGRKNQERIVNAADDLRNAYANNAHSRAKRAYARQKPGTGVTPGKRGPHGSVRTIDDLSPKAKKVVTTGARLHEIANESKRYQPHPKAPHIKTPFHGKAVLGAAAAGAIGGGVLGGTVGNAADKKLYRGFKENKRKAAVAKGLPPIPKHGLTTGPHAPMSQWKPPASALPKTQAMKKDPNWLRNKAKQRGKSNPNWVGEF